VASIAFPLASYPRTPINGWLAARSANDFNRPIGFLTTSGAALCDPVTLWKGRYYMVIFLAGPAGISLSSIEAAALDASKAARNTRTITCRCCALSHLVNGDSSNCRRPTVFDRGVPDDPGCPPNSDSNPGLYVYDHGLSELRSVYACHPLVGASSIVNGVQPGALLAAVIGPHLSWPGQPDGAMRSC